MILTYGFTEAQLLGTIVTNIFLIANIRLSYNMTSADCAGALFYSMMKLAVETSHTSASKYSFMLMILYMMDMTMY